MKRLHRSFNIYFACLAVWTLLASGCASDPDAKEKKAHKKEQSTIRLYMEGPHADVMSTGRVKVTRAGFEYNIQRDSFLNEADLAKAALVKDPDGSYGIQLAFNEHGTLLLEMYTADNIGRHIIVFSQFPVPGKKAKKEREKKGEDDDDTVIPATTSAQARDQAPGEKRDSAWMAAVLIRGRISNGVFMFTPDTSLAEAERIVRGLKNVIAKAKKKF